MQLLRALTRLALALAVVATMTALALVGPVRAATATDLDAVAAALRSDPVYVDPAAERALSQQEADRLRDDIAASGAPVFVAVLPAVAGDPDRLPADLGQRIGLSGTVAVVAGDSFRAASNALPRGEAGRIATAAFQAHRDEGTAAVLDAFVGDVATAGSSAGDSGGSGGEAVLPSPTAPSDGNDGGGGIGWVLPVLAVVGLGAFLLLRRRRRQRADQAAEAAVSGDRLVLRAHVDVLAQDVLALEPVAQVHPEAAEDYAAGVQRYRLAEAAVDRVRDIDDVVRVQRVLDEASYAMDRVRAVSQGRPMPPPPPSLQVPGPHAEPALALDERDRPMYVGGGPSGYGGGFGGFYGPGWFPGTGLLSGLMLGSILGGGWGGWGGGNTVIVNDGDGDGGAWGDGGGGFGGDWGGGFGGDFGGDIGGGDWG